MDSGHKTRSHLFNCVPNPTIFCFKQGQHLKASPKRPLGTPLNSSQMETKLPYFLE